MLEYCKEQITEQSEMLTGNLESMQTMIDTNSKNIKKNVKKIENFSKSKIGKLDELLNGHYMTGNVTKQYVEETLLTETDKLNKKFMGLTNTHQIQIDELYFNHVAVPGLINHTVPSTGLDFGQS